MLKSIGLFIVLLISALMINVNLEPTMFFVSDMINAMGCFSFFVTTLLIKEYEGIDLKIIAKYLLM